MASSPGASRPGAVARGAPPPPPPGPRARAGRPPPADAGRALALGAFLDGVPEQMALGIGLAAGAGISVGVLVAIFVSNLPEAIGSATEMEKSGTAKRTIMRLWLAVGTICALASVAGY